MSRQVAADIAATAHHLGSATRPRREHRWVRAVYTRRYVFGHKPGVGVYWCAADIGRITGRTHIGHGPAVERSDSGALRGHSNFPDEHQHWQIIEKYGVTALYTAPTLVRAFMKWAARSSTGTTCRAFASWARRANRSTRRHGHPGGDAPLVAAAQSSRSGRGTTT